MASARALLLLGVALAAWAAVRALPPLDPGEDDDYDDDDNPPGVCERPKLPHDLDKTVLVCCEDYEQISAPKTEDDAPECRPVCKPACVNATCTAPNICSCNPNFTRRRGTPINVCVPLCDPFCVNAQCVGPNECRCHDGYQKTTMRHMCQKRSPGEIPATPAGGWDKGGSGDSGLCSQPCGANKHCVGVNKCACNEGFSPDPRQPENCIFECTPPCKTHAYCLANKSCRCITGYKDDDAGECVPECDDGCEASGGRCVAPGKCQCNAGYEKFTDGEDEICVPQCKPACGVGGDCVAPNNCSCYETFQRSVEGDCTGICSAGTMWNRESKSCVTPSTFVTSPVPPTPPPPPPPPPPSSPPPRPTEKPSTKVSPTAAPSPCVPPCVHGRCGTKGACECVRGWTGVDCARPCQLRDGSLEFDPRDCHEMVNCTCTQPAPDGKSCVPGARLNCEESAITSPGVGEPPKWLWWAVGGGVVGALILFVVIPSAVALQRRHKKQPRSGHDTETLQGKGQRSYTPGGGRAHDPDEQWQFMPS